MQRYIQLGMKYPRRFGLSVLVSRDLHLLATNRDRFYREIRHRFRFADSLTLKQRTSLDCESRLTAAEFRITRINSFDMLVLQVLRNYKPDLACISLPRASSLGSFCLTLNPRH